MPSAVSVLFTAAVCFLLLVSCGGRSALALGSPYALVEQCPTFAPCLSPSSYRDYFLYPNGTMGPDADGAAGLLRRGSASASSGAVATVGSVALDCEMSGRSAIVTPLFGHVRLTTDDVSPLRRLATYGLWGMGDADTGAGSSLSDASDEYEEALLSGLVPPQSHAADASSEGSGKRGGAGVATASFPASLLQTATGVVLPLRHATVAAASYAEAATAVGHSLWRTVSVLTRRVIRLAGGDNATTSSSSSSAMMGDGETGEEFAFDFEDLTGGAGGQKLAAAAASLAGTIRRSGPMAPLWNAFGAAKGAAASVFGDQLWRRLYNTFIRHIPRIFGRVVTRVEYSVEASGGAGGHLVPTLKMFVVRPRRVVGDLISDAKALHAEGEVGNSEGSAAADEREAIPDGDAAFAGAMDGGRASSDVRTLRDRLFGSITNSDSASVDSARAVATATTYDGLKVPLRCEGWEGALADRLLHTPDAPDRDVFPDGRTRRRQVIAAYRKAQAEGLVEEVCRPFRSGWLPPWLQAKLSWTGTESSTRLFAASALDACSEPSDEEGGSNGDDAHHADGSPAAAVGPNSAACRAALEGRTRLRCEVSVPVAAHACLVVESIYRDTSVEIAVSQAHVWDATVLWCLGLLAAVAVLRPILATNPYIQLASAATLGIVAVLVLALWLVVRDLRKSRIGQVGAVGLLTIGGFAAVSETVANTLWYYVFVESRTNGYVQLAMAGAALAAALASRFLFYDRIAGITRWSLSGVEVLTWAALASHNREAAAVAFVFAAAWRCGGPIGFITAPLRFIRAALRLTKWALFCVAWPLVILFLLIRVVLRALGVSSLGISLGPIDDGEPVEVLPEAARQARAYVRPLAREGIAGPSAEAKFQIYAQQGSEHTRRALRELGESIRRDPAVLGRLHDANGVARYFDVGTDASGAYVASDDEE